MTRRRQWRPGIVLAACALALLTARPVAADWLFAPFLGATFKGTTTLVDFEDAAGNVHRNYGIAVTKVGRGPIGVEGYFVYTPGFFDHADFRYVTSSRSYALMGNVVLTTPRHWNEYGLRPFVSGGLGFLNASENDVANVFPISENLFAWNAGGGATGFFTDFTGIRFDLRFFKTLQNSSSEVGTSFGTARLQYWTGAIGLVLKY